jgi:phage baseplate assembly protein W
MAVRTPHFAAPFRVTGSSAAVVEQDSQEEIESCVEAVLRTPVGSRIEEPGYGIPDETFTQLAPNPTAEVYLNAIAEWEPRARETGEARIEELTEQVQIRPEASAP